MKFNFANFLIILFIFLSSICIFINSLPTYDNPIDAMKSYPVQDKKSGRPPKFIFFKFKREEAQRIDYWSSIIFMYMNTMGAKPYFVNMKDEILMGIIPRDIKIDKDAILENFEDILISIEEKLSLE